MGRWYLVQAPWVHPSALHEEWARQVQIFGPDKRRQAVEKAAATRAKNKVVRRKQAEREKRQETALDYDWKPEAWVW